MASLKEQLACQAAVLLARPYVEFRGAAVYHLVNATRPNHLRCSAWASVPYVGRDGTVIDSYIGGCPFPDFVEHPSAGRRLCTWCAKRNGSVSPERAAPYVPRNRIHREERTDG